MTVLIIIIILALIFDFINGFHDAANSIATIVSTKVLTPFQAVVWAAVFNFVAFFIFKDHAVANTIGKTVHSEYITLAVILSGLIAAIFWNLLTWWFGIPSSSSHTLIGGFAGAAIAHALLHKGVSDFNLILEMKSIFKIVLFIFLAPMIGMFVAFLFASFTYIQNTWLKTSILTIVAIAVFMLFDYYEQDKLNTNLEKYYGLDKLKKELVAKPELQTKIDSLQSFVVASAVYLPEFDQIKGEGIAMEIKSKVDPGVNEEKLAKALNKSNNRIQTYVLMSLFLIIILAFIYAEKVRTPSASRMNKMFKNLQLASSAAFSIGHGGNDAQKVMGIIAAAFVAYYGTGVYADTGAVLKELNWVPLACYTAIGLGTMSGGWKIVKTMGTRITKVTPVEGVTAETSGAFTLFITEQMGIPVSTTHTITGSIIGVGATKRLSAVRWGVTVRLLWAWILTIPVSAAVAMIVYYITSFFIQ